MVVHRHPAGIVGLYNMLPHFIEACQTHSQTHSLRIWECDWPTYLLPGVGARDATASKKQKVWPCQTSGCFKVFHSITDARPFIMYGWESSLLWRRYWFRQGRRPLSANGMFSLSHPQTLRLREAKSISFGSIIHLSALSYAWKCSWCHKCQKVNVTERNRTFCVFEIAP